MNENILILDEISTGLDRMITTIKSNLVVVRAGHHRAGAGVILHEEGLVLTNNHVLGRRAPFILLQDERQLDASILARNPDIDLALLQIPAHSLSAIPMAESLPRIGELVLAIGHPWGQRDMVTKGIVSALITAQTRGKKNITLIRTDVPLAPGNSGGPLINAKGQMIGINTMIVGGDQSVAIPAAAIQEFLDETIAQNESLQKTCLKFQENVI